MHSLGFLSGETLCGAVASGALCARGEGCVDALPGSAFCLAKLFAVPRRRVRCEGRAKGPPRGVWRVVRAGWRLRRCAVRPRFLPGETLCGAAASDALCARGGGCADVLSGPAFCLAKLFAPPWRLTRCARGVKAAQMRCPASAFCLAKLFAVPRRRVRCAGAGRRPAPVASGASCARGGGCADVLLGLAFCLEKFLAVPRRRVRCAGAGRRPASVASGALCARGEGYAEAWPRLFVWRNSL